VSKQLQRITGANGFAADAKKKCDRFLEIAKEQYLAALKTNNTPNLEAAERIFEALEMQPPKLPAMPRSPRTQK
jgi:hypothetical protein